MKKYLVVLSFDVADEGDIELIKEEIKVLEKFGLTNIEDRFMYEKQQQGWDDELDEEIWNEHFKNK